jgi:aminoglycoside phosphotransferase
MTAKIDPPTWPSRVRTLVKAKSYEEIAIGLSRSRVYRCIRADDSRCVLKIDHRNGLLTHERDILDWLSGRLAVPDLIGYVEDMDHAYLITTEVDGLPASAIADASGRIGTLLGEALRHLHAVPTDDCPFDDPLPERLVQRAATHAPVEAMRELESLLPHVIDERVFVHGDYSLPNVLIDEDEICRFVDLDRAGLGHPHLDLFLLSKSMAMNGRLGDLQAAFKAYGIGEIDRRQLRFFQIIDQYVN